MRCRSGRHAGTMGELPRLFVLRHAGSGLPLGDGTGRKARPLSAVPTMKRRSRAGSTGRLRRRRRRTWSCWSSAKARACPGEAQARVEVTIPEPQRALAEAVAATGKPVVVLLRHGRALALSGAVRAAPAILATWFLGSETGNAMADVVFGDIAPRGSSAGQLSASVRAGAVLLRPSPHRASAAYRRSRVGRRATVK